MVRVAPRGSRTVLRAGPGPKTLEDSARRRSTAVGPTEARLTSSTK